MTNKPMLSVEREKHIRLQAEMGCRVDHRCTIDLLEEIKRLREINAGAPVKLCSVCNGFGRYQDGDSGTDEDGRCPNVVDCDCDDSERIPEYRATHTDDLAVDSFALSMKAKLAKSRDKGRGGWESCRGEDLSKMLRDHVDKGDPVDVANFCMFLATLSLGIYKPAAQHQGEPVAIDDNVEFEKWWMSTPILRKQKIQIAQESWFARAKLAEQPAPVAVVMPEVDELAQIIRKVDGSHNLGAGSLAEAILEEVAKLNGVAP